jgi:hypothetical protein
MIKPTVTVLTVGCSLLAAFAGCNKSPSGSVAAQPLPSPSAANTPLAVAPQSAAAKFDACTLLTGDEVGAIQEAKITEAKNSERSAPGSTMSQCFYTATEFTKSVTLTVTRADPGSAAGRSPRDIWRQTFGRFEQGGSEEEREREREGSKEKESGRREEEESKPPMKIEGVGEAAYWTSGIGGTLYVLKGDAFLRVSVGGPAKDDSKLEKAKALAAKAAERL